MSEYRYIESVEIENLHGQYDVALELQPGLNVIYGKNGRGKTTIQHIIANALEQDFQRFQHLTFTKITLRSGTGDVLEISGGNGEDPIVLFNGSRTSYSNDRLSPAESDLISASFGSRSTYLPAFRSILERTQRPRHSIESRDAEFERIVQNEIRLFQSAPDGGKPYLPYDARERAANTASKTMTCRQWFGMFVPIIRYPSIADVEEGLAEEWSNAQTAINRKEQLMFEDTFIRVFRSIAGIDKPVAKSDAATILASIERAITERETSSLDRREDLFAELNNVLQFGDLLSDSNTALLEIYNDVLLDRNTVRRSLTTRTRDFENSVNLFLDNKELKIGVPSQAPFRGRGVVYVKSGKTEALNLSVLSSGERQILTMLYSASRNNTANGPFLIDEPELSLHVDWQRIVLREIGRQSPGRQIIACTHSPEVGADHMHQTQDFEPLMSIGMQHDLFGPLPDEDDGEPTL